MTRLGKAVEVDKEEREQGSRVSLCQYAKHEWGRINLPWRWRGGAVRWRGMFSERSGECGVAGIEGVEDVDGAGCTYIKPATTYHHKVSMCNEMMRSAGSWASLEQSTSSHGIAMEP